MRIICFFARSNRLSFTTLRLYLTNLCNICGIGFATIATYARILQYFMSITIILLNLFSYLSNLHATCSISQLSSYLTYINNGLIGVSVRLQTAGWSVLVAACWAQSTEHAVPCAAANKSTIRRHSTARRCDTAVIIILPTTDIIDLNKITFHQQLFCVAQVWIGNKCCTRVHVFLLQFAVAYVASGWGYFSITKQLSQLETFTRVLQRWTAWAKNNFI